MAEQEMETKVDDTTELFDQMEMTAEEAALDESTVMTREHAVREDITATKARIESDYLRLAELLTETRENGYYSEWGYRTFIAYCDEELGIKVRTVQYMISIYEAVRDLGLSDQTELIQRIGWTKMRMLVPAMRKAAAEGDMDRVNTLLTTAEGTTARDLQTMVKVTADTQGDGKVGISFRADENAASVILDAIDSAKADYEVESIDTALESICYDYLQRQDSEIQRIELSDAVDWLNRTYGTDLSVEDADVTDSVTKIEEEADNE